VGRQQALDIGTAARRATLAVHLPHVLFNDPYLPMLRELAVLIGRHLGRRVA
jgi:hypothetical protein